jgi:hypothetical protein
MCWWKTKVVCAWVIVFVMIGAGSARGEAILRLDQESKGKAAPTPAKKTFSPQGMSARNESELEPYARFLLAGKKEQPSFHLASSREKTPEPPIQWDDKHAKKLKLKKLKLKIPPKPVHHEPVQNQLPVQWDLIPTPMAASATELPASVPAPKSIWAGLAVIGVMGACRWVSSRRVAAAVEEIQDS